MSTVSPPAFAPTPTLEDCRAVELRDYLLHAGRREVLIELFDRAFVASQEAVGRLQATSRSLLR